MTTFPALFVSHGAPTLILDDVPARDFLGRVGGELGRPRAIVVVSAHYAAQTVKVTAHDAPPTIHDFRGFPEALYRMTYPAPGAPDLAADIVARVSAAGLPAALDTDWGFDHGTWVPLMLMYPEADIPVVAVSVNPDGDPATHARLGEALAPLRAEGVLVVASGSFTHNLFEIPRPRRLTGGDTPAWVTEFAAWLSETIVDGRAEDMLDYRARAPHAERNHPTDEHLLPLFAAWGAGGRGAGRRLHSSNTLGVLQMDAYAFG
ncbi:MAG: dioxygenase [Alphaproteobacteria bacterium]|nr:dioxygenase [Alphaproteobacteria bacterium]